MTRFIVHQTVHGSPQLVSDISELKTRITLLGHQTVQLNILDLVVLVKFILSVTRL